MKKTSNLNRWDSWYSTAEQQQSYGGDLVYELAADWLEGLPTQDWGCGYAYYKNFHRGPYTGVDGTKSKWNDVHADLTEYTSDTPGIMLRGVLEHDPRWAEILDNAVASFTDRMFIALFTPLVKKTVTIEENVAGLGVPDISFALKDITDRLIDCEWTTETLKSQTAYNVETVIRIQKDREHDEERGRVLE